MSAKQENEQKKEIRAVRNNMESKKKFSIFTATEVLM